MSGGSNSSGGYSTGLYRNMIEADANTNYNNANNMMQNDSSSQLSMISSIKSYYDRAVEAVTESKSKYLEATICLSSFAQRKQVCSRG